MPNFDDAMEFLSRGSKVAKVAKTIQDKGPAILESKLSGCASIPDCLDSVYIYFITRVDAMSKLLVVGYSFRQAKEIADALQSHYNYAVIIPQVPELGFKWITAGSALEEYANADESTMHKLREENKETFYITDMSDIDYLNVRLTFLWLPEILTREDIEIRLRHYRSWAKQRQICEKDLCYQGIKDIAIGLLRNKTSGCFKSK